jgi:nucleoside-diphosphate-sugar epimerase
MTTPKILIIGANGQIGFELAEALALRHGRDAVVTSDIAPQGRLPELTYEMFDVTDADALQRLIDHYKITQIYHLAAALSARAEQNPTWAWHLNMTGLFNVLEAARLQKLERIFWPSSIAVFGATTPQHMAPQKTVTEPSTIYGISKLAGEGWCDWYHKVHGVDIRSLRYPGLISYKSSPGGGTTDYAVDIFHHAVQGRPYTCFLKKDTALPLMYMPDAVRATIELMEAPASAIRERRAYNLAGMSITPAVLAEEIARHVPGFKISYAPDFRQRIAQTWPASIDDGCAQHDWGWKLEFDLPALVEEMLEKLR